MINRNVISRKMGVMALLCVMLFTLFAVSAMAETRLNISINELVTRNVTFAENFDLTESVNFLNITGFINVSNPSNNTVYDIYLLFENTALLGGNISHQAGRNGTQLSNTTNTVTLHIPELRVNDSSYFNYSVANSVEILNLTTDYSANEFSAKVLAGENFTITQFAANQLDVVTNLTNVNITMQTQGISWNNSETDNFTFQWLNTSYGDWNNVSNGTDETRTWYWTPHNGTLEFNKTANITFVIKAPDKVPSSGTYMMLLEHLQYETETIASNITFRNATSKLKVDFNVSKQIVAPSTNANDPNVTWQSIGNVGVPYNVSYQLTQVDLWVSASFDPNVYANDSITGQQLNTTYFPEVEVNETAVWQGSAWLFNYTDGSNGNPPPIVWMKPEYHLLSKRSQILNFSVAQNATDLYMKYIYVIAGYWLQVEKNVTSIGEDQYGINITVWNRGNAPTPQNLTVTVYDLVPQGFTNTTMQPAPTSESAVIGSYNGTAVQWDIPQKAPLNASLFARNDPLGRDFWNASYQVFGNGTYRVSDLYIVGLDPRQVDGAFSSPLISIIVGLQTYSKEILYLGIVMFLLVLNVTNLVVSQKINRKIDQKLPYDHHKYMQMKKEIEHLKRQIK